LCRIFENLSECVLMCLLFGVYVIWVCVGVCEGILYFLYVYLYVCITFVIISAFVVNKEIYINKTYSSEELLGHSTKVMNDEYAKSAVAKQQYN